MGKHRPEKIKALFLPNWSFENPYQNLLIRGLQENGVEVVLDNYERRWPHLFRTVMKHRDCTVVHLHWINPYINWIFRSRSKLRVYIKIVLYVVDLSLVKLSGGKICWTIHNKFRHEERKEIEIESRLRRLLIRFSDHVLVHTENIIPQLLEAYKIKQTKKITVVPHGHYIDCYPNQIDKETARRHLGIDLNRKVVLFLGTVRPYKGVINLIHEFKDNKELSAHLLLLVGKVTPAHLKKNLEAMVQGEQNIQCVFEFVKPDQIQLYMNAADICVFPFEEILTSGSVILAMSFGKALVVPSMGCLTSLVDEHGAVFFGNQATLGQALARGLQKDADEMGRHNREVIEQYDWKSIGASIKKIYEQ